MISELLFLLSYKNAGDKKHNEDYGDAGVQSLRFYYQNLNNYYNICEGAPSEGNYSLKNVILHKFSFAFCKAF